MFNTLLDGFVRHNDFQSADALIADIDKYRIEPSTFTLGIIVKMWGRRRRLDEAFNAVKELPQKYGFAANGPVFACLMRACLLAGDVDRALLVLEELKCNRFDVDSKAYRALIAEVVRVGRVEEACKLTKEAY